MFQVNSEESKQNSVMTKKILFISTIVTTTNKFVDIHYGDWPMPMTFFTNTPISAPTPTPNADPTQTPDPTPTGTTNP